MLNASRIFGEIAQEMAAKGPPRLTCDHCDRTETVTQADTVRYLSRGWPKCCGQTMKLTITRLVSEAAPPARADAREEG